MKEFTKFDQEKPRTDLLAPQVILEIAQVLGHGARKYEDNNWKLCETWKSTYVGGAALRHIFAYMDGEEIDPESGLPHLAHAMCSLMFARQLDIEAEASTKSISTKEEKPKKVLQKRGKLYQTDASSDKQVHFI